CTPRLKWTRLTAPYRQNDGRPGQPLDVTPAIAAIGAADPSMGALIQRAGPYEPRPGSEDPFAALARAIMYQQLAGRAAAAIHGRFVQAVGGRVTPEAVLAVTPETLRAAGLSGNKAAAVIDLAWPLVRSHGYTSSRCISGFFDPFNNGSHTLHTNKYSR